VTSEALTVAVGKGGVRDRTTVPLGRVTEASSVLLRGGTLRFGTEKPGLCLGFFNYPSLGGEVWVASHCGESGVLLRSSSMVAPLVLTPVDREGFIAAVRNGRPGVFQVERSTKSPALPVLLRLGTFLLLAGIALAAFVVAPRRLRYRVSSGALEIQTFRSRRSIPVAGCKVRAHKPLTGERLSGITLPGYVVGSFSFDHQPTGVYASHKDDGVLIETDERIFINPADREGMLAALVEAGATQITALAQRRL
jgi:hypothetical protein